MRKPDSSLPTQRRMLCAWFPQWPLQRLLKAQPELRDRPVLLYRRLGRRGCVVAACSETLAARGVRAEMPLAEARSLAGGRKQNAALAVCEHDPLADRMVLERLAEACHRFSPTVALADECPDALWLDVTGLAHLEGPGIEGTQGATGGLSASAGVELAGRIDPALADKPPVAPDSNTFHHPISDQSLLHRVAQAFAARGWQAQLAVADSFAAAYALARFRAEENKPLWVEPGKTRAVAAALPIEALRLSAQAAETLAALGIGEVEQLECLPRAGVGARLGTETTRALDRLLGRQAEAMQGVHPAERWEAAFDFETPLADYALLSTALAHLLNDLARRLAERQLGATRLVIALAAPPAPPWRGEVRLFRASAAARHWLELATLELERARLAAPVSRMAVTAATIAPLETRQQELFADSAHAQQNERRLATLVNRLVGRLGHQDVTRVTLAPDPLPEAAYRTTPAVAGERTRRRAPPLLARPLERPLELLPLARQEVRVTTDATGAPAAFCWRGEEYRVVQRWGPERIESGWWRGRQQRRDYYRAETNTGAQAWLFRRLDDNRWFLHGWFA